MGLIGGSVMVKWFLQNRLNPRWIKAVLRIREKIQTWLTPKLCFQNKRAKRTIYPLIKGGSA